MEFRILGPLELLDGDEPIVLGGGKQRALLAVLLVNANRVVPVERLVDDLWGEEIPETGRKMVQVYVSHLRKALPPGRLRTRAPGYVIDVGEEELDLRRFERGVEEGRAALAGGDAAGASSLLADALSVWRGPALAEFAEPFARAESARLEEFRLSTLEDRIEADLARGRQGLLVGELGALVERHPLRERLRDQQMRALYGSGRQAEALAGYQEFRRRLAEELGIEPSAALKELERRMLRQDPELAVAGSPPGRSPVTHAPPEVAELSPPERALPPTPACARCGRANSHDARFCSGCGADLVALRAPGGEERKVVTVLFADVSGSTALGERLDAESLKELMDTFFGAMRVVIEAEGGTVEKFIGDAVMAAFGVPRVHEDDPARALRAALRMRARLEDLNAVLEERYGVRLELRIGINTGEVIAAVEPGPGEALATGDAVNAAARLERAARPGQVLVAERTARAARGFRFAEPQPFELPGKTLRLRAVELIAEQAVAEEALSGARAPLVGRRRELELLGMTYHRVVEEGRPHLVTLYGDAGVGKSRLVAELLAGLEAAAPTPCVVRGRCLAYGDGITYWPLAELLRSHAGVLDTDPADVARASVTDAAKAALASAGVGAPTETAAALAASIGLGASDWEHHNLHELRAEIHLAWRSFFSALAATAPTIVLVEDLHWADPALLELLEDVADRAMGPIVLLCTARPELTARRPTWGGGRRSFTGLVVEPLSAGESRRLVELLLDRHIDEEERSAMIVRAEGNPFFLEEIVRAHASSPGASHIPDTVQSALAARIDLLPADEKRVLQAASVVGRVFWPGAVAEVTAQEPASVEELLDRLQERDLVLGRLSSSMKGQRELIFKHALIRDVAYEGLPRRDRIRIHSDLGDWIEQTYADRRDEIVELLAHHRAAAHSLARTAELRARAFLAIADAAESALARSGFERAVSLARDALELAQTPEERARTLEVLGYAAFLTFDGSTAWDSLREAADIISRDAPGERSRLARVCGFAVMIPARTQGLMRSQPPADEVMPYLDLGLACAGAADSEALVLLLASQGSWEFGYGIGPGDDGGERGRRAAEHALAVARRIGRPDLELLALDSRTSVLQIRGLYGLAEAIVRERLELARRTRDPFEVGDTFYTAAWLALEVGRYTDVLALTDESEALDLEQPPVGMLAMSALAHVPLGSWDEALAAQERLLRLIPDDADPPSFAMGGFGAQALIHQARGEKAAADADLAEVEAWGRLTRPRLWPFAQAAVAYARRGEFEAARRLLAALLGDGGCRHGIHLPRELEARCALIAEEGDWDEAAVLIAAARSHATEAKLLGLPLHADRLEGRALLAAANPEDALAPLKRAAGGFARLGARWELALTELTLGEALVALDRHPEAEPVLERAATEFARLRVPRELAQSPRAARNVHSDRIACSQRECERGRSAAPFPLAAHRLRDWPPVISRLRTVPPPSGTPIPTVVGDLEGAEDAELHRPWT